MTQDTRKNRKVLITAGVLGLFALVGAGLLFWYLNQPVPEEATLEGAVENIASSTLPSDGSQPQEEPGEPAGVDGTWTVDTTVGSFSFEEATSSFVGFRIREELVSFGAATAVGRTPAVDGALTLEGAVLTEATIEADMSRIVTNADKRNRSVQQSLETGTFPIAIFTLTSPVDLGAIPAAGETVSVAATGDLEIKGVVQTIEIPLEAQIVDEFIVVVGSVDITFADWGVELPTSPGVVSIEDHGLLEVQLFFSRG